MKFVSIYYLTRCRIPPYSRNAGGQETNNGRVSSHSFRLFAFNTNCTNRENIFRAVLFLYKNLRNTSRINDEFHHFAHSRNGSGFKDLAGKLEEAEPTMDFQGTFPTLRAYRPELKGAK